MSKSDSSITAIYVVNKMLMLSQQYDRYTDVFFKENVSKLLSH